jgi:hypothetical protein
VNIIATEDGSAVVTEAGALLLAEDSQAPARVFQVAGRGLVSFDVGGRDAVAFVVAGVES